MIGDIVGHYISYRRVSRYPDHRVSADLITVSKQKYNNALWQVISIEGYGKLFIVLYEVTQTVTSFRVVFERVV